MEQQQSLSENFKRYAGNQAKMITFAFGGSSASAPICLPAAGGVARERVPEAPAPRDLQ